MIADTGTALLAAVRAAPADDAPWLVYADWLQEQGRDAEAAAIREHLPALRAAVGDGYDVVSVVDLATRHPPGGPAWEAMFGHRSDLPDPAPITVPPPAPSTPAPAVTTGGTTGGSGQRIPIIACIWVGTMVVRALIGVIGKHGDDPRPPVLPPANQFKFQQDWVREPGPIVPARPDGWGRDELAGHTFRQLQGGVAERTFAFHADGLVEMSVGGPKAAAESGCWEIDPSGVLVITGPGDRQTRRLTKVGFTRDLYLLSLDGERHLYERRVLGDIWARPPSERRD